MDSNRDDEPSMVKQLTDSELCIETKEYYGTGGTSQENGEYGFLPAFLDNATGDIYLSRHSDGSLAKIHLLDGLPAHIVIDRNQDGRVRTIEKAVSSGFVLNDIFFTRDQALEFVSEKISKSA